MGTQPGNAARCKPWQVVSLHEQERVMKQHMTYMPWTKLGIHDAWYRLSFSRTERMEKTEKQI
jgi:alkylated DNA repair dioxygenase AlkB